MKSELCEICLVNVSIGVACTSIPYSCRFCAECARRGADPEWVFIYFLEEELNNNPFNMIGKLITYYANRYMSFHEWAKIRLSTNL